MTIRRLMKATVVTALLLAPAARADEADPMRCQALEMRKHGQWYDCLSRCDQRQERRAGNAEATGRLAGCRATCDERLQASLDRVDERAVCNGGGGSPDPNRCEARLLRAAAAHLVCQSECASKAQAQPAFDAAACQNDCDDHYEADVDRILAKDFCAGHPMPATH